MERLGSLGGIDRFTEVHKARPRNGSYPKNGNRAQRPDFLGMGMTLKLTVSCLT